MTGLGFIGVMLLITIVATGAYMVGWRDSDLASGRTRRRSRRDRAL